MVLFKGDAPVQINESSWEHWCRVLEHTLTCINFDYCDHCCDPSPKKQAEIHEQQIAMFEGVWCDKHNRTFHTYFDGEKCCPTCLYDEYTSKPHPASPYEGAI